MGSEMVPPCATFAALRQNRRQRSMSRCRGRGDQPASRSRRSRLSTIATERCRPPGAPHRHRQVAAVLLPVARQQVEQQVGEPVDELDEVGLLRRGTPSTGSSWPVSGRSSGDEVRVGQEAHVEEQVGAGRDAVLEAEARPATPASRRPGRACAKAWYDLAADLVDVPLAGVEHQVGEAAQLVEHLALAAGSPRPPAAPSTAGAGGASPRSGAPAIRRRPRGRAASAARWVRSMPRKMAGNSAAKPVRADVGDQRDACAGRRRPARAGRRGTRAAAAAAGCRRT